MGVRHGCGVADENLMIELSTAELREVAGYAVACAKPALAIFERERPDDRRPRAAIEAAQALADGAQAASEGRDEPPDVGRSLAQLFTA